MLAVPGHEEAGGVRLDTTQQGLAALEGRPPVMTQQAPSVPAPRVQALQMHQMSERQTSGERD